MSLEKRLRFLDAVLPRLEGRGRTYVGLASNSLGDTLTAARAYAGMGVDALVGHLPNYYPLSAGQMHAWFTRLADAVSRPLYLYNIPMTTRMSIPVETIMALGEHPNIAGMKDSEYDRERMARLLEWRRGCTDFEYFVGPSVMALYGLRLGADGFVPGVGNVVPEACRRLLECARAGDWDQVVKLEGACVLLISQLKQAARDQPLARDEARIKSRIMQRILVNDAEVRHLAEPWLPDLHRLLQGKTTTLH